MSGFYLDNIFQYPGRTWRSIRTGCALDIASHIICHPLDYAHTLIQIGYEPFPPEPSGELYKAPGFENIQTRNYLLPSVIQYLQYINAVDGFGGCFRGLVPSICSYSTLYIVANLYNSFVTNTMDEISSEIRLERHLQIAFEDLMNNNNNNNNHVNIELNENGELIDDDDIDDLRTSDFHEFLRRTTVQLLSLHSGLLISHPFHVLAVRSMAQFVGRETKYSSIFGSIAEIFINEGLPGFYKGVSERVIGHTIYFLISAGITLVIKKMFNESIREKYFRSDYLSAFATISRNIVASYYANPFFALANMEAIEDSGLAIDSPPFTEYQGKSITNGYLSFVNRLYFGPFIVSNGQLKPSYPFGPKHPNHLGFGN